MLINIKTAIKYTHKNEQENIYCILYVRPKLQYAFEVDLPI